MASELASIEMDAVDEAVVDVANAKKVLDSVQQQHLLEVSSMFVIFNVA